MTNSILAGKSIVMGISGGIAAYKSVEVLRLLQKQNALVRVIMTENATRFVGPLTFQALSGMPVCINLFEQEDEAAIRHIDWAAKADAVIVAPATANTIGKFANGIADDALSTFMLAVTAPKLLCPSMNTHMYENQAVQKNIDTLESYGWHIVEPTEGELACGTTGAGRLADPAYIVDRLTKYLYPKDLAGKRILVTAGPTIEPIDPVRYISNHSSGKMGYAIARAAEYRGAEVILISGPTELQAPHGVQTEYVKTNSDMAAAVFKHLPEVQIVIKVAAVADYRPEIQAEQKIKKNSEALTLRLTMNQDILKEIGRRKKNQIVVGFAAETEDLEKNATKKLDAKNLDLIVGNLVGSATSGFGADTNKVTFFGRGGAKEVLPLMGKDAVAQTLIDRILQLGAPQTSDPKRSDA